MSAKRKILSPALGVDDFGWLFYKCQFTGEMVIPPEFIFLGAVTPQVNGSYVCAPDANPARRESVKLFHESEANCNTCKKLERIPHAKQHPSATHRGICKKIHLYPVEITFHPDDFMGMDCWEARA